MCEFFKEVQKDILIYGSSSEENTSGFNFCDKKVLLPNINDTKYFTTLLDFLISEKINGILSFFDQDVHLLSGYRNILLDKNIIPFIPEKGVADICFDKCATYEFLRSSGFNTPATFLSVLDCLSVINQSSINFPVIIKPRKGFASKGIFICHNEKELAFFSEYLNEPFIIQELIDGQEHGFDILNGLNGETLSVIVKKKLMMRSGETDMSVTIKNKEVLEVGISLSEKLGSIGPLDVDFFIDKNGKVIILEMNPRFGGGYPGSHLAGAEFPSKLVKLLNGELVNPDIGNYKEGIYMFKDIRLTGKNYKIDYTF